MNRAAAIGGTSALAVGLTLAVAAANWREPSPPVTSRHAPEAQAPATPDDFLRLTDPADRHAFAGWFTFLAELQFFREPAELPAEIADCAGLVRFAFREALRRHDAAWANQMRLPDVPPLGSITKYQYPYTPLKAALFRIRDGETPAAFAEFADARTLLRFNARFVSRDLAAARPGDLLFFHQPDQARFPYHVMIYLGEGRVRRDTGPFAVYHTGPDAASKGEIRRPSIPELAGHPNPHWRPTPANSNFLGVYRWNILD